MRYRFHPEAREELIAAALYYESQRSGLGDEFLDEVDVAIAAVLDAPERWPEVEAGIRRYRLDRFPYGLIYRHFRETKVIQIEAVMELHRRPGYWHRRLS